MPGTVSKNKNGYGYKYADIAQIHNYLESVGVSYWQYIEREEGDDYIYTVPVVDGEELPPRRGCRVVQATLNGKNNPAQEQGSALTYARRYSLLMAFGLATNDDDAEQLAKPKELNNKIGGAQIDTIIKLAGKSTEAQAVYNMALEYWETGKLEDLNQDQAGELIQRLRRVSNDG